MSYLSIEFSLFFIGLFSIYWCLRFSIQLQNFLLLAVSYLIVGLLNVNFALLLFGYTAINFGFAKALVYFDSKQVNPKKIKSKKKVVFIGAILFSIINLAIFKYFDFFRGELQAIFHTIGIEFYLPTAELLLPIGISFYTFHCISYLVSIYKKEMELVSFWEFALFLSFFPSIVAGPINRAKTFLPQIESSCLTTLANGTTQKVILEREILEPYKALTLILLAIIKVYWLSSALEQFCVNPIFNNPSDYHSLDLLLGVYAYTIQIYLNFSGYTDLVTGIALLLGFRLPINFNLPYLAYNLRDFWHRWHISLSTWIRDYLYFPLGGSRCSLTRTQINLMIAMLLSGLWHGAGLNFIIWGGLHGIGMIFLNLSDHFLGSWRLHLKSKFVAKLITIHFICFTWIFFRSESLSESFDFIGALFQNTHSIELQFNALFWIGLLFVLFITYQYWAKIPAYFSAGIKKIHWALLPFIFIVIVLFVVDCAPSGIPLFIYGGF